MNKKVHLFRVAFILMLGVFLMGMGSVVNPGQGPIESPFDAKIKDTSNNEVSITSVTFDGKTIFSVYMGKGRVEIPFDTISRIEMKEGSICVSLKGSGSMCNLKTNGILKVYGKLPYGMYQIALKDVVWIELIKAKQ
ncbi:MAG: hypothetical protein ABSC14_01430 [Desulfomonilia bacterium]|jgi:hypothetical protein